ncbi:MATE family efflux transporter [bacterium]|nr:MATE family efflux transporter [bacterium]
MLRIFPTPRLSREVMKPAVPVVVGMLSQTLVNLVDTAMVGRLGAAALAAVGMGGVLSWLVLGTMNGLNVGVQAVTARRYGEERWKAVGRTYDNAAALALSIGLIGTMLIAPGMRAVYPLFVDSVAVAEMGQEYLFLRLLGALPFMVIAWHKGFFNGVGATYMHMRVAVLVNLLNVGLNYMLIFGHFGAPKLGAAGAGLASTLATLVGAVVFFAMALGPKWRKRFGYLRVSNLRRDGMWSVVRLALPSGFHDFSVMLGFTAFMALVARVGTVELAAANICIAVMSFSFLPGAGIGTAAATLVGQELGRKRPDKAEEYGWEAGRIGAFLMGFIGLVFIFAPQWITALFTTDPAVIEASRLPLRIIGAVQAFDALGMVFSFALYGAGLNRFVMIAEVIINWTIFLPLAYFLMFVADWKLTGAWTAFAFYIVAFSMTMMLKFRGSAWKTAKV